MTAGSPKHAEVQLAMHVVVAMFDCSQAYWTSRQGYTDQMRDSVLKFPAFRSVANVSSLASRPSLNMMKSDGWVHGRPVMKGSPLLRPLFAARADQAAGTFALHVILLEEIFNNTSLKGAAWRFEQPSWAEQGPPSAVTSIGSHDFFHCQWTDDYGLKALDGTNVSQPSFPLAAASPLELALCAWTAVYGLQGYSDLVPHLPRSGPASQKAADWLDRYHCRPAAC